MSSKSSNKRTLDDADDDLEIQLVQSMQALTVDRHFECPNWLLDYALFAACVDELKDAMRMSLVNYQLHNYLTAIKDAFRTSALEKYFESDAAEAITDRETFKRVFDDRIAPHKTNSYRVTCPDDADLDVVLKKTMRHIERVCFLLDLDNLFIFLALLAKLRLQPFTNPVAVSIHRRLDVLTYEEACAALDQPTANANAWTETHFKAVRREVYWTYRARAGERVEWEKWQRDVDTLFTLTPFQPSSSRPPARQPAPAFGGSSSRRAEGVNDDKENRNDAAAPPEDASVLTTIQFTPSSWTLANQKRSIADGSSGLPRVATIRAAMGVDDDDDDDDDIDDK